MVVRVKKLMLLVPCFFLAMVPSTLALVEDNSSNHQENEYYAVIYELSTGYISSVIAEDNLEELLWHIKYVGGTPGIEETGEGAIVLDESYPNQVDIFNHPSNYIVDLEENRVRLMTQEEKEAYEEHLRGLGVVDILESIDTLPDNRIRATLSWATYRMYVETNSSVLGVKFDSASKQLFIEISGTSGTSGTLDLMVPQELVPSTADVAVHLDGSPIDFTLTQDENYYSIHVEYTHSTRTLTVSLTALPAWYAQPLNLALIGGAIVFALGVLYWLRFRK
jgi:hypothetical protein